MLNTVLGSFSSGVAASTSSYESIASATGTGSAGNIVFSSIPSGYVALQLRVLIADTYTGGEASATVDMRFNGDTGSNYTQHALIGDGSTAQAVGYASTNTIRVLESIYGTSGAYSAGIVDIHNYTSTTQYKTVRGFAGSNANTANTNYTLRLASGLWQSTSAITSITLIPSITAFKTGSTFALYGIKG